VETNRSQAARPRWIAPLLLVVSLAVGWPLLLPWTYDTHDGHYALYNAAQFDRALRDGELPVRWLPDLFGGRGLPVFLYYHPLAFYGVSLVHATGLGFIASMKLLVLATLPLSGWTMLRWLEEHLPSDAAAVGAAAYVAAPIHVVELHVKGDPPAALAYVFAPLVLLGIRRAAAGAPRGVATLALAGAGLALAHSVTALIMVPAAALYALAVLPRPRGPAVWRLLFGGSLAVAVAAFHVVPALVERPLVAIDTARGILAFDFREHFVAWWQWLSPLWGYHGSFPGAHDDMSFQIGPAHVAAIALVALGWRRARGASRPLAWWGLAAAALSLAMTLTASRPLWNAIRPLVYVQFPWRFLMPAALASSALAALAVAALPSRRVLAASAAAPPLITAAFAIASGNVAYAAIAGFQAMAGGAALMMKRRAPLGLLFAALAVPWSAVPLHARLKGRPEIIPIHEADLAPERVRLGIRRTTARDDYLPMSVAESAIPPRDPSQEYLPPPGAAAPPDVEVRSGGVEVTRAARTARALVLDAHAPEGGIIALEIHDFPGWEVDVATPPGSSPQPIAHGRDDAGRIVVSLPPGESRVTARWTETPFRQRCDLASALGLLVALTVWRRAERTDRRAV